MQLQAGGYGLQTSFANQALPHVQLAEQLQRVQRGAGTQAGFGYQRANVGAEGVLQDLLGLSPRPPVFAQPVADFGSALVAAGQEWVRRVAERSIGQAASSTIRPAVEGHSV